MVRIIQHTVSLPARPRKLFDMYLDPAVHAAITGSPVIISPEAGSDFQAFDGMIFGKTLAVVPGRSIVQIWRGKDWAQSARDSILVLSFLPDGDAGKIELVQVNVPENEFDDVNEGWQTHYWKPWKEYLEKELKKPALRAA